VETVVRALAITGQAQQLPALLGVQPVHVPRERHQRSFPVAPDQGAGLGAVTRRPALTLDVVIRLTAAACRRRTATHAEVRSPSATGGAGGHS
jgi:hypothetical protein